VICVLDASALLAAYQREPGWERVERDLDEACIGTVNLSEAAAKLVERGRAVDAMRSYVVPTALTVVPFEAVDAYLAAEFRHETRRYGLSFADRACLALGRRLALPVLTTDRAWAKLDLGVTVEVIR
jgi:ribonuclease VapC